MLCILSAFCFALKISTTVLTTLVSMVDPAWITLTTTLVSAGQDLLETTAKLVRIDWHSGNSKMSHSSFNNRYSVKAQGISYCVTLPFLLQVSHKRKEK